MPHTLAQVLPASMLPDQLSAHQTGCRSDSVLVPTSPRCQNDLADSCWQTSCAFACVAAAYVLLRNVLIRSCSTCSAANAELLPTCSQQVCAESRSGARIHALALSRCHFFGMLACMQRWAGTLCFVALVAGSCFVGIACGSSVAIPHKDAGQPPDVPSSSGGASGSGGAVGSDFAVIVTLRTVVRASAVVLPLG